MFESLLSQITPNLIPDADPYLSEVPPLPEWEETLRKVLEEQGVRLSDDLEAEVLGDPPMGFLARVVKDDEGLALQLPDQLTECPNVQYAEAILHEAAHLAKL